jgi:hypothetical protein
MLRSANWYIPTFRDSLSVPSSWVKLDISLTMESNGYPETSVTNYHSTLRNIPEERRSHLHRGGSLKSQYSRLVCVCVRMCTIAQQLGYNFKPQQKPPLLEYQNKSCSATSGTDYSTSTEQTNRVIRLFLLLYGHTKARLRLPISQVAEISNTLKLTQSRYLIIKQTGKGAVRHNIFSDTLLYVTLRRVSAILQSFHSVFCLTTGPTPLPKRFLHIVRSRASSFK